MNEEHRPDPEHLLEAIQKTESRGTRGRLKIFLGMAAGVGKTFAMLEDAHRMQRLGHRVMIGIVNTHGRVETERLVEGLTVLPEKEIEYRGTIFKELDLDAILKTKPELVIVDELAHTNIPGSRHFKRWQDITEILDHGIDVYTTLNIQHIESLKDVVESITGITITETVPDSLIEEATSIELIDLTPTELLQRLKEGKVYLGPQSEIAARHFFQEDRLTALREMSLRFAAEKVDHELHGMVSTLERESGWKTREKLLVTVNESPRSQKLIRMTRRLAFVLNAPWVALYVDPGTHLDEAEKTTLAKNLALARDLGAEVVSISDPDLSAAIERIARQKAVTQILLGRSNRGLFFRSSFIDKLVENCSDIDIHVIRHTGLSSRILKRRFGFSFSDNWPPYVIVFLVTVLIAVVSWFLTPYFGYKAIGLVFLLGILLQSLFFRKGPILFASIASALIWNSVFIPTMEEWNVSTIEDAGLLLLFVLTGIFTGILTDRARRNKEMLTKSEASAQALYEIARGITTASSQEELCQNISLWLEKKLKGKWDFIIKKMENGITFEGQLSKWGAKEKAAAEWVFENGKEAGWSTRTLPSEKRLYVPLNGYSEVFGVLAYEPEMGTELSLQDKNFVYDVVQQIVHYLERTFTEERERKKANLDQTEKIYQTVFDMVSNKFKDPLRVIQEAIGQLKKDEMATETALGKRSVRRIENSSEGLLRDIENISSIAKLSAGHIPLSKSPHQIKNLLDSCFEKIRNLIGNHSIKVILPNDLPEVSFDFSLLEILVSNLILNAVQNSPAGTTITIEAVALNEHLRLSVADEGQGIPPEILDTVFERFKKVRGTKPIGLGLGLSIAKTIADIHKARLWAENLPEGGTIFILTLPLMED